MGGGGGGALLLAIALLFADSDADAQQFENAAIRVTQTVFDENVGTAVFRLVNRASAVRSFDVSVRDGSGANAATLGNEFQRIAGSHATTGRLLFGLAGASSRELNVPIINDNDTEGNKTFIFRVVISGTGAATYDVPMTIRDDDDDWPFTVDTSSIAETNLAANFSVLVTNTASSRVTMSWTTVDGTATAAQDYTARTGSLGVNAGSFIAVNLQITNDTVAEDDETFFVRITIGSAVYDVPLTIEKNDQPAATLNIGASGLDLTEGDTLDFTVTLSAAQTQPVTVNCTTLSGGEAVAGSDYTALDVTLTFAAGDTSETCSLVTIDDTESEANEESIKFGLTSASGGDMETDGSGGVAVATGADSFDVNILDNDQPLSTLSFVDTTPDVDENAGNAVVMIKLDAPRPIINDVTVRCQTQNASAIAPGDFTVVDHLLTFTSSDDNGRPYSATKPCSIPIVADGIDEGQEQITVVLANPTGGATLARTSVNLAINDTDDPPMIWLEQANREDLRVSEGTATFEFTLRMSAASEKEGVALGYRLSGTATPGYDDQLIPPETGEDYTVSYQRAGGAGLTAKTVVGTENAFEFRRTNGNGQIVLIAGETSKTFTVHVNDDQLKETDETVVLELVQNPDPTTNQGITDSTALQDLAVDQSRKAATLTLESDEGGVSLMWYEIGEGLADGRDANQESVPEGDRGDPLEIVFQPAIDIDGTPPSTIALTVTAGTATEGDDYLLGATVTPTLNYISSQGAYEAFGIEILADEVDDDDEYFEVVISDTAGNQLAETFRVTIEEPAELDPILIETGKFAIARAEALLENQPRLIPMLRDTDDRSEFILRATEGGVEAAGGGFRAETVWGATTLSRTADEGREHEHLLATLGAHFRMSERLHLGGVLQFDRSVMKADSQVASGEIGGRGWMAGPYFAARDASHPLFFEGRLLYGRSSNDVEDLVLDGKAPRSASFDSERWLAQARVEGMYALGNGATLIPLADLSHALDEMEAFLDNADEQVAGQTVGVSKLQIGAELEIPVDTARGDLLLKPGLRFVASDASGEAFVGEESGAAGLRFRGRIDFGIDYRLDDDLVLAFGSFYSGLGRKDLESYGAGLDLRLEF